jgi:hypothetical protein
MAPNQTLSGTVKKQSKMEKPQNIKSRIRALSSKPIVTVRSTFTRIAPKTKTKTLPLKFHFAFKFKHLSLSLSLYKTTLHTLTLLTKIAFNKSITVKSIFQNLLPLSQWHVPSKLLASPPAARLPGSNLQQRPLGNLLRQPAE